MRKKRILVVDDSVVVRRSLADALSREHDLEVAGSAPNGRIALMKLPLLNPDVVLLDIEMPEMSGLDALAAIRKEYPRLPVVILSVPSNEGIATTFDALALGAIDYVTKPDMGANAADLFERLSHELAVKLNLCCPENSNERSPVNSSPVLPLLGDQGPFRVKRISERVDVVVIGVSTGGPNALMDLMSRFPANFPVPVLIVQHMPAIFTKLLAERLSARCEIHVAEGLPYQQLFAGDVWIAPGDFHMAVERKDGVVRIQTHQNAPENFCRPSADVLFRSVVEAYGSHVLAVVMTGMGQDGLQGCQRIHAAGGQIIVQDEASSVIWGMPRFIARAGLADQVLPLNELAPEIIERVSRRRLEKRSPVDPDQRNTVKAER
jgi:two-component system chemotaxis response regulator CheB